MKVKRVNRYYCDFCKKSGCSKPALAKHEKHCTMNPARECRMCAFAELSGEPLSKLIAIMPTPPTDYNDLTDAESFEAFARSFIPKLRTEADGCPTCMMAAIRQSGWRVPAMRDIYGENKQESFDYKKESDELFEEIHNAEYRAEMNSHMY